MRRKTFALLVVGILTLSGCSKPSPEEKWVSGIPDSQIGALCATLLTQFTGRDDYIKYWRDGQAVAPNGAKDLDPKLLYDAVMKRCS